MVDVAYAKAFSEVLEILKHISKEDYEKIPLEIIEIMEDNSKEDYNFSYNPKLTLENQNVSDEARTIIAILFRDYWSTNEQKTKIIQKEKYDQYKENEESKEIYNIDIFKNDEPNNIKISEENKENMQLIVNNKKDNIIKRFFKKIKKYFIINKYKRR